MSALNITGEEADPVKGFLFREFREYSLRRKAENEEKSVEKLVNYLEVNIHRPCNTRKTRERHTMKKRLFIFSYITVVLYHDVQ